MEGNIFCDPRYGAAMLKVAFGLKEKKYEGIYKLFEESLCWLKISRSDLEAYLVKHRTELERRCRLINA